MENQNINQEQPNQPQGWKDVVITPDMSLGAIVQFLNILNQRLCTIEDNLLVEMPTGEKLSITQVYALQAEAERQEQNQAQGE
jgi:hypothetical protein